MSIEGGSPEAFETRGYGWIRNAEAASEMLQPGVLEVLDTIQPEGDRAMIKSSVKATGHEVVPDSTLARLWQLSKFDDRAYGEMSRLVREGRCSDSDILAVFCKMIDLGLF